MDRLIVIVCVGCEIMEWRIIQYLGALCLCAGPLEIGHWGALCFTPVYFDHEELTSITLTENTYVFVCEYADGNDIQCIYVV